jgi:hypothetical protein
MYQFLESLKDHDTNQKKIWFDNIYFNIYYSLL